MRNVQLKDQEFIVRIVPQTSFWAPLKFELQEPLTFEQYTVPLGFVSNGASVPRPLWWLVTPMGPHAPAAFVHDHLVASHVSRGLLRRKDADKAYYRALLSLGMPKMASRLMYLGARVGSIYLRIVRG